MEADSLFGTEPDRLKWLLKVGRDENESVSEEEKPPTASIDGLMEKPGARIGRYKLQRLLGEGGMGTVYLAQQEKPVARQVALKIIKLGMDSKRVIARFETEQQALALMEHSHVARVYDAGLTANGRPYFVMEYVKGIPIAEHCDKHKLTVEERLGLFLHVCEAVQHAHQKGIIHRDLKPSNILVSIEGNEAVPKVIDFGVARAVSQQFTERTLYTEQGQLIGTPEYMSPEQADLNNQDIDTRTDIYSLGVVLYELLAGIPPFDPQTFQAAGIEHMRKVICEEEPKTPSTRLSKTSVEELAASARRRRTNAGALQRRLRGDLDWITLKAMDKDRTRRYASAGELATDIRRHLNHEPVLAGPPGAAYRLNKFVRRNRTMVTGIAAILVVLTAGIVVSMVFALGQARARAEAQAVSSFVQHSVLESLDPFKLGGRPVTIRSVLDRASKDLQDKFYGPPMAEAEIRYKIGRAYMSLGLYEVADVHMRRAVDICRAQLGSEDPKTLHWVWIRGSGYLFRCRFEEAEKLLSESLEGMRRVLGTKHEYTLHTMASLGLVYYIQGRFQEAEQLFREAVEINRLVRGEEHEGAYCHMWAMGYNLQGHYKEAEQLCIRALDYSRRRGFSEKGYFTLQTKLWFGDVCVNLGRYEDAERYLLDALNGWRDNWGEEFLFTLWTKTYLGWLYYCQGRYQAAEELLHPTLETARRVRGEVHLLSAHAMLGLGTLYLSQGRYDEAEPLLQDALGAANKLLGENNWLALYTMNTLAHLYRRQDHHATAETLYLTALKAQRRVLGDHNPYTLATMNGLALLRRQQGHFEDANDLFHEALRGRQNEFGEDHPATLESLHDFGVMYLEQGRHEQAETKLLAAYEGRKGRLGPEHLMTVRSLNKIIQLYEAWGKPEEAEKWRSKLPGRQDTGLNDKQPGGRGIE